MALRGTSELHKFMSTERGLKFLEDRTLRFTQPAFLNDPYECHLTLDREAVKSLKEEFQEGYKRHFKDKSDSEVLERTEAHELSIIENALSTYRKIRNDLGVLSLTEDPFNLLMWAHYADEHRGLVVELDYSHPSLNIPGKGGDEFAGLFAVNYTTEKICGVPTPDNVIDTLLTKSLEWAYEKEWRFVRTLNRLKHVGGDVYVVDVHPEASSELSLEQDSRRSDLTR